MLIYDFAGTKYEFLLSQESSSKNKRANIIKDVSFGYRGVTLVEKHLFTAVQFSKCTSQVSYFTGGRIKRAFSNYGRFAGTRKRGRKTEVTEFTS